MSNSWCPPTCTDVPQEGLLLGRGKSRGVTFQSPVRRVLALACLSTMLLLCLTMRLDA